MKKTICILRVRQDRSGVALMGSIVVAAFLTILIATVSLRSEMRILESDMHIVSQQALYAAEAGLDRAVFELRRNPVWGINGDPNNGFGGADGPFTSLQGVPLNVTTASGPMQLGGYSLTLQRGAPEGGWNTVWIRAQGFYDPNTPADPSRASTRIILARVRVINPANFLAFTLGDIEVAGGAIVNDDIFGNNIIIDSIGAITLNGELFYTSATAPTVGSNVSGSYTLTQTDPITFVGVDKDRYRDIANGNPEAIYQPSGDLTINLDAFDGETTNIIYAEGDIYVQGGSFDHSIVVVAGGNIYIQGDIKPEIRPILADGGNHKTPQIGLFADKDVIISGSANVADGDLEIEAFIIADGDGDSKGVFRAERSANLASADLRFTGAMAVRGERNDTIDLEIFNSRDYRFNESLNNNRSIPFTPFVANVIRWDEIDANEPMPDPYTPPNNNNRSAN